MAGASPAPEVPDALLKSVGDRVRYLRRQQGISRRVLSETSGVSPRYLAQLEAGEGNMSISLLAKVARALGHEVSALVVAQDHGVDFELQQSESNSRQLQRIAQLLKKADADTLHRVVAVLESVPDTRQQRICLIGLRGAGKSTLGRLAGGTLDVPFVELNDQIEVLAGMPVAEIIALYGPDGYRDFESKALSEVINNHSQVILAAAGGIVSNRDTYRRLLGHFHTVWLKASASEHMQRVLAQGDTRPMAGNPAAMEQLKKLLLTREASYAEATCCIDTEGRTAEESHQALVTALSGMSLVEPSVRTMA